MTAGSLFAGIGGLDLGLERAGHTVRWQVEANPYCQRILAKHWPHVPCYPDVTQLTGTELAPVDLICGGFPCQPVSHAGLQKGTDDDRWLWPHFARLLGVLRPRYALLEHGPGLLTANGGHAFGEVIGDLADLGYNCEWSVLSAADVGAPHLRKRVFLIANLPDADDQRLEGYGREYELGKTSSEKSSAGSCQRAGNRFFDAPIGGATLADADDQSQSGGSLYAGAGASLSEFASSHQWWESEPDVGRVAHGVPHRVDRLKALGNAVVPQVAEWLGRRLTDHETTRPR